MPPADRPGTRRPAVAVRAPTMEDVAAAAGVSRALVSIVFRDVPGASEQTRARVRAAASELGYRLDHRARLLGRSRTGLVGVTFGVRHSFHADLVEALYAAAATLGYDLVLSGVTPGRGEATAVEALLSYRCEALVLLGPTLRAADLASLVAARPAVVVARRVRAPGIDVVRTDDAAGAALAVEHLLELGHRRIGYVDGGTAPGAVERRRGFRTTMRRAGLDDGLVLPGGLTEADGVAAAERLLTGPSLPSAVAVFNDRCAFGVLSTLRAVGRTVPGDLSLVGFDDDRLASLPHVDLTTVRQDRDELARLAMTRVAARLDGGDPAPADLVAAPRLVVRGTTAPGTC
jgi:DNA-binding LacI/PurR family transcriptional regulator